MTLKYLLFMYSLKNLEIGPYKSTENNSYTYTYVTVNFLDIGEGILFLT